MREIDSNKEQQVSIGYVMLVHRYPAQLLRLIDRLDNDHATFFVHVDKRTSPSVFSYLYNRLSGKQNVRFIRRFKCYWAGFGIIQATLQGIKEAVESNLALDHLVLLSGQDYPIKSNEYINRFLLEHKGTSFVNFSAYPRPEWANEGGGWWRLKRWNFIRQNFHAVFPGRDIFRTRRWSRLNPLLNKVLFLLPHRERKFPLEMHPYGGAQFWCLSKKHFTYIHDFVQKNPGFVRFFRFSFAPDESLIQTIVGNSGFQHEVHNDTLHFLEWYRPGAVLNSSDKDSICSTYHLFARKFDTTVDARILDFIDKEILEKEGAGEAKVLQQKNG